MTNKYFYVRVIKKNAELGSWYNDFVDCLFLVKNDSSNRKQYELADGCAWIQKRDAKKYNIEGIVYSCDDE